MNRILINIIFIIILFYLLNKKETFKNFKQKKNLIYLCCFLKDKYIKEVELLLKSISKYGNIEHNTDIIIITDYKIKRKLKNIKKIKNINIKFYVLNDVKNVVDACFSRYRIIFYKNLNIYNKILYLDTDILVMNNLKNIFNIEPEKITVLKEGSFGAVWWGKEYFSDEIKKKNISAFSSGVIYFKNNNKNIDCFKKVLDIKNDKKLKIDFFDQPVLNYILYNENNYDNETFNKKVINNPEKYNNETICHFPGGVGNSNKCSKMLDFLKMNNLNLD